jgi:hypothetical protein
MQSKGQLKVQKIVAHISIMGRETANTQSYCDPSTPYIYIHVQHQPQFTKCCLCHQNKLIDTSSTLTQLSYQVKQTAAIAINSIIL